MCAVDWKYTHQEEKDQKVMDDTCIQGIKSNRSPRKEKEWWPEALDEEESTLLRQSS